MLLNNEDANSSVPVSPNSAGVPELGLISSPELISSPVPTDSLVIPTSPSASLASSPSPESNGSPGVNIPGVLQDLAEAGASFVSIPPTAWLPTNNGGVRLSQELSVTFSLDSVVTSQDVVEGFADIGINLDHISCIQFKASNHTWIVTFNSMDAKNIALGMHNVYICGHQCFLSDCENRMVIVNIFEAPTEMPDSVLIGRLSAYGKVFSFCRDKSDRSCFNGVRTARMRLQRAVPSVIRITGIFIRVWFPGQPKTSRRCEADGYLAVSCNSTWCFNCEEPGHCHNECDKPILCPVC